MIIHVISAWAVMRSVHYIDVISAKQKTAYEMLACDWSSDVCSSDLLSRHESNSQQAKIMELSCEESCCSAGNNQAAEQAGITQHSWQLSSR